MKINFSKKAMAYVNDKKISNIVIDIDLDSKASCCGLGAVDFVIMSNAKDKFKNYKKADSVLTEVYYSPSLEFYFNDESIMDIGCVGFFNFKKLYVANEINILAD